MTIFPPIVRLNTTFDFNEIIKFIINSTKMSFFAKSL